LVSASLVYGAPLPVAEVKAAADGWEVAGYASTWDRDLGGDVVHPGAFAAHLGSGAKVRFLYAHDAAQVLGRALELREDDRGLFGRFRISKTRLGQDVHQLLTDGALDSFSIGFIPRDFERDEKSGVRNLKAVELVECSVVAMPMNPQATVTAVKALDGMPIEDVLNLSSLNGDETLRLVNALWERRREEGQRPSDRLIALVEGYRQKCQEQSDALLKLLTTPAPAKKAAASAGDSLVDAHLRRARLRELGRLYGVTTP
jgi:HK97 family phage prohead protease